MNLAPSRKHSPSTSMLYTFADLNNAPPPNFIIFGEMGVGKSSLINLIAGEKLATASSGPTPCTLEPTKYTIRLPDSQCDVNLYDMPGLDEPNMNHTAYLDAAAKAHQLIVSLQKKGGIHGLLFCIRGGRISDTMQKNYSLFYNSMCKKKVPLSLVIMGLEHEQDSMDRFWAYNQTSIEKAGIASVAHVCITTLKGYDNAFEKRYLESRKKVHMMLNELILGPVVNKNGWYARMCKRMR